MKRGRVVGIVAIKGGVGKTTVASALAADLVNNFRKKVLLVDANYSSPHVAMHMNIEKPNKTVHDVISGKVRIANAIHTRYGVDVIPGDELGSHKMNPLRLKDKINSIKNKYDFVIIDASPSLNEELLSTITASDSLLMVSTPDAPTLSSSIKAAMLAKHRNTPINGIIVNKIRNPKYELTLEEIEEGTELPVIAKIPDDDSLVEALFNKTPATLYKKNSNFSRQISTISAALTGEHQKLGWIREILGLHFKPEEVNREIMRGYYDSPLR